MSSLVIAHCGSCGTGGSSKDHDESHKSEKMEQRLSDLNLTEKQESQVRKINKSYKKAKNKIKAKRIKALSKVLTAEQMKQYQSEKASSCGHEKKSECSSCES